MQIERYHVKTKFKDSLILVGETLANVSQYIPKGKTPVIITDENLFTHYETDFPQGPVITIGTGEAHKTLATVEDILRQLVELGCDRSSFILGIGGGIVCDIAGFAASIYLRGVEFGFVSTSLLSQVDASVGGKNGVNLDAYKNMVGVFNQPEFVICDLDLLSTLPDDEISNGLAESVKHGLIHSLDLLEYIEASPDKALSLDREAAFKLVSDSVAIKSSVVQADEREAGERRKLNFGHTIGHAVERLDQAGHGRAVSIGMVAAAQFSVEKGFLAPAALERIKTLLKKLNLPIATPHSRDQLIEAASRDKKKKGDALYFVFLEDLGKARVEKIAYTELNDFIQNRMA